MKSKICTCDPNVNCPEDLCDSCREDYENYIDARAAELEVHMAYEQGRDIEAATIKTHGYEVDDRPPEFVTDICPCPECAMHDAINDEPPSDEEIQTQYYMSIPGMDSMITSYKMILVMMAKMKDGNFHVYTGLNLQRQRLHDRIFELVNLPTNHEKFNAWLIKKLA